MKVSHLPTYLHHSKNDRVSSFTIAEDTYNSIKAVNDNIILNIGNTGHSGWSKLYGDESIIRWLLSWEKINMIKESLSDSSDIRFNNWV